MVRMRSAESGSRGTARLPSGSHDGDQRINTALFHIDRYPVREDAMLGKRSAALLLFLALLMSVMVSAPAAAQPAGATEDPDATFAELSAADQFEKVLVAPGISQPMSMDIADDGRVFMTSRDGVIRVYHPHMGHVGVVAELDVFDDHPLPQNPDFEGSKNQEGGLLGLALDPDFATN